MKTKKEINLNEDIKTFKTKKKEKKRQKQADKLWSEEIERRNKPILQKIKEWFTPKKISIILLAFIIVVIIIKTVFPPLIYNLFTKKEVYYIKNNDLYVSNEKKAPIGSAVYDQSLLMNDAMSNKIANVLKMDEIDFEPIYDKKSGTTIYAKEYNKSNNIYTIAAKQKGKENDEYEIDGVERGTYKISKNNDGILYKKLEDGKYNLYYSDFKRERLLEKDVKEFFADDLLDKMYVIANDDLYFCVRSNNNKKTLIATNSFIVKDETDIKYDKILAINDFNNICFGKYTNENKTVFSLYKKLGESEPQLISEECTGEVVYFENEDYLYYQKQLVEPRKISDYVEDDISNGEFDKTEPKLNDFMMGLFFAVPDYFSYSAAKAEWDRVKNFVNRNKDTFDKYVQQIDRGTYNAQYKNIFYYTDGKSDTFCDEKIKTLVKVNGYKPYIFFEAYKIDTNKNPIKKQKLSDIIKSNSNISTYMKTIRDEGEVYRYIYFKNEGMRVRNLSGDKFEFYEAKDKLILHSISDDKMYHTVFSVNFDRNTVVDAISYGRYLTNNIRVFASPYIDDVIYTVDYGNDRSYMYVNETQIEREVMTKATKLTNDLKNVLFITEYNYSKGSGVLNIFKDGNKKTIAENVLYTMILSNARDGAIYYLTDFDGISLNGKLYMYDILEKNSLLDDRVNGIINKYTIDEKMKLYREKSKKNTQKSDAGVDFGENYYQKF